MIAERSGQGIKAKALKRGDDEGTRQERVQEAMQGGDFPSQVLAPGERGADTVRMQLEQGQGRIPITGGLSAPVSKRRAMARKMEEADLTKEAARKPAECSTKTSERVLRRCWQECLALVMITPLAPKVGGSKYWLERLLGGWGVFPPGKDSLSF